MSLDTDQKKLQIMEWCSIWEPGLPATGSISTQQEQQHLLWGNPDTLWITPTLGGGYHFMNDILLLKRKKK